MMSRFFNANLWHNIANVTMLLVVALVGFDWSLLGIDAERALLITGILTLLKMVMNVVRDGVTGLVKVQPPVED